MHSHLQPGQADVTRDALVAPPAAQGPLLLCDAVKTTTQKHTPWSTGLESSEEAAQGAPSNWSWSADGNAQHWDANAPAEGGVQDVPGVQDARDAFQAGLSGANDAAFPAAELVAPGLTLSEFQCAYVHELHLFAVLHVLA